MDKLKKGLFSVYQTHGPSKFMGDMDQRAVELTGDTSDAPGSYRDRMRHLLGSSHFGKQGLAGMTMAQVLGGLNEVSDMYWRPDESFKDLMVNLVGGATGLTLGHLPKPVFERILLEIAKRTKNPEPAPQKKEQEPEDLFADPFMSSLN